LSKLFLATSYREAGAWFAAALRRHPDIDCTSGRAALAGGGEARAGDLSLDEIAARLEARSGAAFVGNIGGMTALELMRLTEKFSNARRSVRAVNLTLHPFRRIEVLYRRYRERGIARVPFVYPEYDTEGAWRGYLEVARELYEGPAFNDDDAAFVRAVFDTGADLVDYAVPLQHVPLERLATDIDFAINIIHELTENQLRLDGNFCDGLRHEMAEAHRLTAPASYLELAEAWGNWRRQVVRRMIETRNADQIYNELGYDLSFIVSRGEHTARFISFTEPFQPRHDLTFRTVYPPLNVEHAVAGDLLGRPRFVAAAGARKPFPNMRRTIVSQSPAADMLKIGDILVSIHMQSNRPANFVRFLDELESKTDNPAGVEVVVKIDDDDEAMKALLPTEAARRAVRVKYVATPNPEGFYGLWRSMTDLLAATDPDAYFLVNLNDEMYFVTKGWDSYLRQCVGIYTDHIFRIRTSVERFRNYHDYWEAGFANDTAAFMTKRWIDLGGGWCPCNGPDSFQQSVAYYLSHNDRHRHPRPYRDLISNDIEISGHGANRGLSGAPLRTRIREGLKVWWILMSHRMQEEASRRAARLDCHIFAIDGRIEDYDIRDRRWRGLMELYDRNSARIVHRNRYSLSRLRVGRDRVWRAIFFRYYAGGGTRVGRGLFDNAWYYLYHRYEFCFQIAMAFEDARISKRPFGPPAMGQINEPSRFRTLTRALYWLGIVPYHRIVKPARRAGARPIETMAKPIARFVERAPARLLHTYRHPDYAARWIKARLHGRGPSDAADG
jgi:hypothetical protein